MTEVASLAIRLRMLVASAEEATGLGGLDARSRNIVYFVAEREIAATDTAVSHIILNERFGSLGTVQRHLYALIADCWLEARAAEDDGRRKDIRLGPKSREALGKMSEALRKGLAGYPAVEAAGNSVSLTTTPPGGRHR